MATPTWALAAAYGLHMLATVAWLGSLAALALLVLPSARRTLAPPAYAALLNDLQPRLDRLGWLSLVVLGATGMFQLSASPHYAGLLAITGSWAAAILAKHLAVLGMLAISAYQTWILLPALRRAAMLQARPGSADPASADRLQRQERLVLSLNLGLGTLVLVLTAVARAA